MEDDRRRMARQVLQRLESLARAGLDRVPRPPVLVPDPSVIGAMPPPGATVEAPAPGPAAPRTTTGRPPVAAQDRPGPSARPTADPAPARPIGTRASAPASSPLAAGSLFGEALPAEVVPAGERPGQLAAIAEEIAACTRCPVLVRSRTRTVPGEGSPTARLMFIGEGPGATEDETGRPFVGKSGALLTDVITKGMGLKREDVFIANVVKCRPPDNRTPLADEVGNCLGYLERQIAIVRPEFLCLLGKPATQALLETAMPMGRLRGRWHRYKEIPTIATWHPSYVLRKGDEAKRELWDDIKMLMQAMGLKVPDRRKPSG
jgi:uracil-DNA glycosylase